MSYQHFFETLKPDSQETAQNFEKRVLQKILRITFYTYKPMNPFHFLKIIKIAVPYCTYIIVNIYIIDIGRIYCARPGHMLWYIMFQALEVHVHIRVICHMMILTCFRPSGVHLHVHCKS
jgi:hypothetical protein